MARIVFYDVNEADRIQLEHSFSGTEHELITVSGPLTPETTDTIAEVISAFVTSKVTRDVIFKAEGLKHIACRSTGFDHVDISAAQERGISVSNVPTYGSHTVAEYAFALLLHLSRKIADAVSAAQNGVTPRTELQGFDLFGKTFGIIGAGRIGQAAADIANGFGMRVIAYDAFPKDAIAAEHSIEYLSLDQLLAESDVVSIHAPYTPDNHHLLNKANLEKMKQGAYLINTARGELVDNRALIDVLESGYLGGAGMDVLEGENLINTSEELFLMRSENADPSHFRHSLEISVLKKLPNVVISKHNAFNTREAIGRINHSTVENIRSYLEGTPRNIVS